MAELMRNPRVFTQGPTRSQGDLQGQKQAERGGHGQTELHTTGDQGDAQAAPSRPALDPPRVPRGVPGHGLRHSKEDEGARERLADRKGWQVLGGSPCVQAGEVRKQRCRL
jgi:hypothetical protein